MLSKELKLTQLPCHPTPALTTPPLPPAPLAPLPWTPWRPPAASSTWPSTSISSRGLFRPALPSLLCPWSVVVTPAPPPLPLGDFFLAAGSSPACTLLFPSPTATLCCCRPLPPPPSIPPDTTPGSLRSPPAPPSPPDPTAPVPSAPTVPVLRFLAPASPSALAPAGSASP